MSPARRWTAAAAGAALIVAATLALFLIGGRIARALAIDACLDRGGVWDYELAQCRQTE